MENTSEVQYWEVSLSSEIYKYADYEDPARILESAHRVKASISRNLYSIQDAAVVSSLRLLTMAMYTVRRRSNATTSQISEIITLLQKKQLYEIDSDGKTM